MKARTGLFRTIQRAFLALLLLLPFSIGSTFGAPKAHSPTVAEQTAPRHVHTGSAEPRLALCLADLAGLLDDPDHGPDPYAQAMQDVSTAAQKPTSSGLIGTPACPGA
ncbi:hypothetical protein ACW9UR_24040 [Halovulum sp. GXIMD14794]